DESELVLVEPLEELAPLDALQAPLAGESREIDAQDARIAAVARAFHPGRRATAPLDPFTDGFVIGRRFRHDSLLLPATVSDAKAPVRLRPRRASARSPLASSASPRRRGAVRRAAGGRPASPPA